MVPKSRLFKIGFEMSFEKSFEKLATQKKLLPPCWNFKNRDTKFFINFRNNFPTFFSKIGFETIFEQIFLCRRQNSSKLKTNRKKLLRRNFFKNFFVRWVDFF